MNINDSKPWLIRHDDPSFNPLQRITGAPREHLIPEPRATTEEALASQPAAPPPPMPTTQTVRDEVRVGNVVLKQTVFGTTSYAVDGQPEVRMGVDTDGFVRGLIRALKTHG
nr:hypothetical protein [Nitrosomonas nitrosa]